MYVPIGEMLSIHGCVFGDTLMDFETKSQLPIDKVFTTPVSGFIQFKKTPDGVCKILKIVEDEQ